MPGGLHRKVKKLQNPSSSFWSKNGEGKLFRTAAVFGGRFWRHNRFVARSSINKCFLQYECSEVQFFTNSYFKWLSRDVNRHMTRINQFLCANPRVVPCLPPGAGILGTGAGAEVDPDVDNALAHQVGVILVVVVVLLLLGVAAFAVEVHALARSQLRDGHGPAAALHRARGEAVPVLGLPAAVLVEQALLALLAALPRPVLAARVADAPGGGN